MNKEQEKEFKKLQKECGEDEEVVVNIRSSKPGEIIFSKVKKSN